MVGLAQLVHGRQCFSIFIIPGLNLFLQIFIQVIVQRLFSFHRTLSRTPGMFCLFLLLITVLYHGLISILYVYVHKYFVDLSYTVT